jgi:hypothetical protein
LSHTGLMCLDLCCLSCSNYGVQSTGCTTNKKETFQKKEKKRKEKKEKNVVLTASRNRPYGAWVGPREIALYQLSSRVVS